MEPKPTGPIKAKRITLKDVKWVKFAFDDYVTEFADHPDWSAKDFGALFRIDLQCYRSGGKISNDPAFLARLCRLSPKEFERVWSKIGKKYHSSVTNLYRKRVRDELHIARALLQTAYLKGLKGSEARYLKSSSAIAIRNETNSKRIDKGTSNSKDPSPLLVTDSLRFNTALSAIIKPMCQGDRTSYHNLGLWIERKIVAGKFTKEIFREVLDYAAQSLGGKKPIAVFYKTLYREIGYRPEKKRR